MRPELVGPRRFFTVDVDVTNLLDLRMSENRAAVELDRLPTGSAIEQMLADYQVLRDQARACR